MRKLYVICLLLISASVIGQQLPKIKGSGNITLKEVEFEESFDTIDIDGDFDIELRQGDTNQYTIETDDNLVDVIQFNVIDNTLKITTTHRIVKKKKLEIIITASKIAEIHLNNEASIESDRLIRGENLLLTAGKGSRFDLDLEYTQAINVELFSDAEGTLKTKAQTSKVALDGRGSLKMYAIVDALESKLGDTSRLTLDGTVNSLKLMLSGSAKLSAKELLLTTADVTLSDASDAYMNVKEAITLYAQDSAVLQLYGEPTITINGLKNKAKILKKE